MENYSEAIRFIIVGYYKMQYQGVVSPASQQAANTPKKRGPKPKPQEPELLPEEACIRIKEEINLPPAKIISSEMDKHGNTCWVKMTKDPKMPGSSSIGVSRDNIAERLIEMRKAKDYSDLVDAVQGKKL